MALRIPTASAPRGRASFIMPRSACRKIEERAEIYRVDCKLGLDSALSFTDRKRFSPFAALMADESI